ncbi:protein FAM151B-like isoform X1 [Oryzias latipes]|uniref:Family with sequence similarity 151 member B n=1 Tax=Oryzias latipes TaxID=8090 RepID=H2MS49_ORYLA|nr:protein FAM151B-like isoform X1 [Oryzias latipes]
MLFVLQTSRGRSSTVSLQIGCPENSAVSRAVSVGLHFGSVRLCSGFSSLKGSGFGAAERLWPLGGARGFGMGDGTLEFFRSAGALTGKDACAVSWAHAVNSRRELARALTDHSHMLEADVILRGRDPKEPVMAHPPDTDSDITLSEWLHGVREHRKGIKLDFKSLEAVAPSLVLLEPVLSEKKFPVWINADILTGPGGRATPLKAESFLSATADLPPHAVLSLGWTTGWTAGAENPGYSWDMVQEMEQICRDLPHAVTFPVRAALLAQSLPQLCWLLQRSDRFSLTVWTSTEDQFSLQDLRSYRSRLDVGKIYFDLLDSVRAELRGTSAESE